VTEEHRNYITIHYKNLQIPPDIHRLNRIAEITIHPKLIPDHIQHIQGYVQVYTSSNTEEPMLEIPFDEIILHGSLDYEKENTLFHIPSSNNELINENTEKCRPVRIMNGFNIPLSVYNITVNNAESLSQYIKVKI